MFTFSMKVQNSHNDQAHMVALVSGALLWDDKCGLRYMEKSFFSYSVSSRTAKLSRIWIRFVEVYKVPCISRLTQSNACILCINHFTKTHYDRTMLSIFNSQRVRLNWRSFALWWRDFSWISRTWWYVNVLGNSILLHVIVESRHCSRFSLGCHRLSPFITIYSYKFFLRVIAFNNVQILSSLLGIDSDFQRRSIKSISYIFCSDCN